MIFSGMGKVFSDWFYVLLALSLGVNFLALDYVLFSQSTTFTVYFSQNSTVFVFASLGLSLATAILFGTAIAMLVFVLRQKVAGAGGAAGSGFFGASFGAIASGCPVCGAWLLPMLGIAGSLAAFPFQGLEIKALAVILLILSIRGSAKSALGLCTSRSRALWVPLTISLVFAGAIYVLPKLPQQYKFAISQRSFASDVVNVGDNAQADIVQTTGLGDELRIVSLAEQINPPGGFTINARFGQIGDRLVEDGVIDFDRFKEIYDSAGAPLTLEQLLVFNGGLDENITISRDNAYFLLNFFWALGLANTNPILFEGEIVKYGMAQIGSFASTGGWTIAAKPVMEIYSNSDIIILTPEQQARVYEVASNAYRPCCGNSTAFPDCNHGMALLGMLQLLAASDASVDEMFEAAKYFNAFWFPREYFDLAVYFREKEGLEFADVDARTIVSEEYSSGFGWSKVKRWLAENELVERAPAGGGGCGV